MSNPDLPPEILDYIIDLLHNEPEALKQCCLISKSWVPRTRKHLFADIRFRTEKYLKLWNETFPDPSTSPARYAKGLFVDFSRDIAANGEGGSWIRGFSRVVCLVVVADRSFSSIPSHGFSPVLKSLRFTVPVPPPTRITNLILSLPLLEDLAITIYYERSADDDSDKLLTVVQPSCPPVFTGSLELHLKGMGPFTRRLLSLPGGIHFRKLVLTWFYDADRLTTMALVKGCYDTLESLSISDSSFRLRLTSIDLSKATKLKDVAFQPLSRSVEWITATLRTTSKLRGLREISIYLPYYVTTAAVGADFRQVMEEEDWEEWLDLDRLLVELWESSSTRPKIVCLMRMKGQRDAKCCVGYRCLFPETTKRGINDLVESFVSC